MTREQATPQAQDEVRQPGSLVDFYSRNGAAWGWADLFMIGDRCVQDHVAEFLAVLRFIHLPDGRLAFHTILVVISRLSRTRCDEPGATPRLRRR